MSATEHPATPPPPSTGGLRDRKRAATRLAIRRAAIELGLEHGYDNVTVDMICAASSVSARTFFNYFGSKEGAYISPPPAAARQGSSHGVCGRRRLQRIWGPV